MSILLTARLYDLGASFRHPSVAVASDHRPSSPRPGRHRPRRLLSTLLSRSVGESGAGHCCETPAQTSIQLPTTETMRPPTTVSAPGCVSAALNSLVELWDVAEGHRLGSGTLAPLRSPCGTEQPQGASEFNALAGGRKHRAPQVHGQ
jgi:hypothetical protein